MKKPKQATDAQILEFEKALDKEMIDALQEKADEKEGLAA